MSHKPLLMIPGPTPVPEDVLRAMSTPMINHRGPEYTALQDELLAGLRKAFRTTGDVQIFPASGTGGLEAAVVNVLSPGDRVVAATAGAFGERFAEIAAAYGAEVTRLALPWGMGVRPAALTAALRETPDARAVLLTHNETSTGVLNDLRALAAAVRSAAPEALILVDSISGMLAADLRFDEWGLDVVVGGSQKAWMVPPGLTFIAISSRAWDAHSRARMPRFYFDFGRMARSMKEGQTPYTPALPQLFGLQVALRRIFEEGLEASFARHARLAAATRAGVGILGLELFAEETFRSNSLTAFRAPEGLSAREIRARMRERHGVAVAGGQGAFKDELIRIGHLGWVSEGDVLAALSALECSLRDLGVKVETGRAVLCAQQALVEAAGRAA